MSSNKVFVRREPTKLFIVPRHADAVQPRSVMLPERQHAVLVGPHAAMER